jgi:hypothetical protein
MDDQWADDDPPQVTDDEDEYGLPLDAAWILAGVLASMGLMAAGAFWAAA